MANTDSARRYGGTTTKTRFLPWLIAIVAGVTAGPATKSNAKPMTPSEVEVTFSMTRTPKSIRVEYVVHNHKGRAIWVADELLQNTPSGLVMKARPELIVRNGDEPDIVSFVRGMTVESVQKRDRPPPIPAMKKLAPKATLQGSAEVPLPFVAWHNYGTLAPLSGEKRRAVFEISYVDDPTDQEELREVPLEDKRTVTAPAPYYFRDHGQRARSEIKPLPAAR